MSKNFKLGGKSLLVIAVVGGLTVAYVKKWPPLMRALGKPVPPPSPKVPMGGMMPPGTPGMVPGGLGMMPGPSPLLQSQNLLPTTPAPAPSPGVANAAPTTGPITPQTPCPDGVSQPNVYGICPGQSGYINTQPTGVPSPAYPCSGGIAANPLTGLCPGGQPPVSTALNPAYQYPYGVPGTTSPYPTTNTIPYPGVPSPYPPTPSPYPTSPYPTPYPTSPYPTTPSPYPLTTPYPTSPYPPTPYPYPSPSSYPSPYPTSPYPTYAGLARSYATADVQSHTVNPETAEDLGLPVADVGGLLFAPSGVGNTNQIDLPLSVYQNATGPISIPTGSIVPGFGNTIGVGGGFSGGPIAVGGGVCPDGVSTPNAFGQCGNTNFLSYLGPESGDYDRHHYRPPQPYYPQQPYPYYPPPQPAVPPGCYVRNDGVTVCPGVGYYVPGEGFHSNRTDCAACLQVYGGSCMNNPSPGCLEACGDASGRICGHGVAVPVAGDVGAAAFFPSFTSSTAADECRDYGQCSGVPSAELLGGGFGGGFGFGGGDFDGFGQGGFGNNIPLPSVLNNLVGNQNFGFGSGGMHNRFGNLGNMFGSGSGFGSMMHAHLAQAYAAGQVEPGSGTPPSGGGFHPGDTGGGGGAGAGGGVGGTGTGMGGGGSGSGGHPPPPGGGGGGHPGMGGGGMGGFGHPGEHFGSGHDPIHENPERFEIHGNRVFDRHLNQYLNFNYLEYLYILQHEPFMICTYFPQLCAGGYAAPYPYAPGYPPAPYPYPPVLPGFDRFGFDRHGFDRFGFDRFGFDKDGFDRHGNHRFGGQNYHRGFLDPHSRGGMMGVGHGGRGTRGHGGMGGAGGVPHVGTHTAFLGEVAGVSGYDNTDAFGFGGNEDMEMADVAISNA